MAADKSKNFSAYFLDRRKLGGMLVHLAMVVVFVGFIGNFFSKQHSLVMNPGDEIKIDGYDLKYDGNREFKVLNSTHFAAIFELSKDGKNLATLKPAKAFYKEGQNPTTEVAIHRSLSEDFYISPSQFNNDGSIAFIVYINPLVIIVQLALPILLIGFLFSFSYKSPRRETPYAQVFT